MLLSNYFLILCFIKNELFSILVNKWIFVINLFFTKIIEYITVSLTLNRIVQLLTIFKYIFCAKIRNYTLR